MTLLSAVSEVCDAVTCDRLPVVAGAGTSSALMMMTLANQAGQEIARRADWQTLFRNATAETAADALPADFARLAPGGGVCGADGGFFRPVTNAGFWALVSGLPSTERYFFVEGGRLRLSPAAEAPGTVVTYLSRNWIVPDAGAPAAAFGADDDTVVFPEHLLVKNMVWRWKRQKGLPFEDPLAEFEADLAAAIKADRGAA